MQERSGWLFRMVLLLRNKKTLKFETCYTQKLENIKWVSLREVPTILGVKVSSVCPVGGDVLVMVFVRTQTMSVFTYYPSHPGCNLFQYKRWSMVVVKRILTKVR